MSIQTNQTRSEENTTAALLAALRESNRVLSALPATGDIVRAICANDAAIAEALGPTPRERFAQPIELADPEDMAIELEEVRAASRVELDAAFEAGAEDGEFTPERWRAGKAREAYVEGWNRTNDNDQRSLL